MRCLCVDGPSVSCMAVRYYDYGFRWLLFCKFDSVRNNFRWCLWLSLLLCTQVFQSYWGDSDFVHKTCDDRPHLWQLISISWNNSSVHLTILHNDIHGTITAICICLGHTSALPSHTPPEHRWIYTAGISLAQLYGNNDYMRHICQSLQANLYLFDSYRIPLQGICPGWWKLFPRRQPMGFSVGFQNVEKGQ